MKITKELVTEYVIELIEATTLIFILAYLSGVYDYPKIIKSGIFLGTMVTIIKKYDSDYGKAVEGALVFALGTALLKTSRIDLKK